jgi:hypothetical protein
MHSGKRELQGEREDGDNRRPSPPASGRQPRGASVRSGERGECPAVDVIQSPSADPEKWSLVAQDVSRGGEERDRDDRVANGPEAKGDAGDMQHAATAEQQDTNCQGSHSDEQIEGKTEDGQASRVCHGALGTAGRRPQTETEPLQRPVDAPRNV